MTTQTYIEWLHVGSFVSETTYRLVADRTPPTSFPERAYGYSFHDRTEVEVDGEKLVGPSKNHSPRYLVGTVRTIEEVRAEQPGSILLSNMECNGWNRVLKCRQGTIPLEDDDVVLGPEMVAAQFRKDNVNG